MRVRAVYINKPGEIETHRVDYPEKKDDEVLIKVNAAGICGSDIGAFRGTDPLVTYPRTTDHEVTGVVIKEGNGMPASMKEGDRVIVDPYVYYGHCYPYSVSGTNCCESLEIIGVHIDGVMQEAVVHPAHSIHKIPGDIASEMVPLAEPLTIALHVPHRTKLTVGKHIVIIGAGTIDLMAALSASRYDATPILVDIAEERLQYARSLGIPYIISPSNTQVVGAIKDITQSTMTQVVVETSGANSAIRGTLDLASLAGRVAFTSWSKQETSLPTSLITSKELNPRRPRTNTGEFEEALRMLATLNISPTNVVSEAVNVDEVPVTVKELDQYPKRYLKISATFH